jgi:hypothetical protein
MKYCVSYVYDLKKESYKLYEKFVPAALTGAHAWWGIRAT